MAYKNGYAGGMDEYMSVKGGSKGRGMNRSYYSNGNDKYVQKSMNLKDGTQASQPIPCRIPLGTGFSEVKPYMPGNDGYPAKAFDYKY